MSTRALPVAIALMLTVAACTPTASMSPTASPELSPSPTPAGELRQVRLLLGFRPDVQFAPFYLAQQDGYYADAGLEVTIEHAGGGELIRLVADGQAEFGVADATDVMIARTSGIPVTYVSSLFQSFPVALIGLPGSVPTDPAELAGMTIGTPGRFGSSWHALLALLDAGGLTEDDVTIREYPQFNQVEGFLAGDVELITGFRNNEPIRLAAEGPDHATDLLTIDDVAPLPGPGVVVGDELLAGDRSLVEAFASATAAAQAAVVLEPAAGLAAAAMAVPTLWEDMDTARSVLLATIDLWEGDGALPMGAIDPDLWESGFAIMRGLGFIDGSVAPDEMYWPAIRLD